MRNLLFVDKQPGMSHINKKTSSGGNRGTPAGSYELDEAQKKFGGAKAISSDQFFGDSNLNSSELKANLNRFQGSNSISSADYFDDGSRQVPRGIFHSFNYFIKFFLTKLYVFFKVAQLLICKVQI